MVFLEIEMTWNVLISPDQLDPNELMLRKAIYLRLLEDFKNRKATEKDGIFVAVTTINNIGEGVVQDLTGDVRFSVTFTCMTVKPCKGEVLKGVVDKILKQGIFLKSGAIESIFLSDKKMTDYKYIAGNNPMFVHEKHSKPLEKDTMVQFMVLGLKWKEAEREFQILGTLDGDALGPISE